MDARTTQTQNIAAAWRTCAPWLARWAMYHLVNRTDLWGRYLPETRRMPRPDGTICHARIAPIRPRRGRTFLTEPVLARHFAGANPEHLLGLHSISSERTSRWLVIDIHRHPQSSPETNFKAAARWYDDLIASGFHPLLIDSNGAGGYHLWVVFDEPVEARRVAEFGRSLAVDAPRMGFLVVPRTFPSLAAAESGGGRNWIRLPGRHYLSDHWTRVWNGRHWLHGTDAVESLLHAHGDSPRLLRDYSPSTKNQVMALPRSTATSPALLAPPIATPVPGSDHAQVLSILDRIEPRRTRAYHEWLRIGMALHDIDPGQQMLAAWERWSSRAPHYAPGLCDQHWQTFGGIADRKSSLVLLEEWANEDSAAAVPLNGKPSAAATMSAPAPAVDARDQYDPELREVIDGWPALSSQLKGIVLGIVRACRE